MTHLTTAVLSSGNSGPRCGHKLRAACILLLKSKQGVKEVRRASKNIKSLHDAAGTSLETATGGKHVNVSEPPIKLYNHPLLDATLQSGEIT